MTLDTERLKDDFAEAEMSDDISDIRKADIPALLIFWALFAIVLAQFFTRYVLNNSLGWTEEAARYFLVVLCFVGAITGLRKGSHIALTFLHQRMSPPKVKAALSVIHAGSSLFLGYAAWFTVELAQRTSHQKMISLNISKAYLYSLVAASLFIMTIISLQQLWRTLTRSAQEVADEVNSTATVEI